MARIENEFQFLLYKCPITCIGETMKNEMKLQKKCQLKKVFKPFQTNKVNKKTSHSTTQSMISYIADCMMRCFLNF